MERLRAGPDRVPAPQSGTMMFSTAVSEGTRLNAWNTTPTVLRRYSVRAAPWRLVTSMPATDTEPEWGVRIAASTESNVVLPQPDAPSSNTSSPPDASSERPSIGRTAYPPDEY